MPAENNPGEKKPDARVEISSNLNYVSIVLSATDAFANLCGFNEDTVNDIRLAISELTTNAVRYGNKKNPEKKVTAEFYRNCNGIEICVIDECGERFDPSVYFGANTGTTRKGNGRGIFIARRCADELTYEWPAGVGTHARFVKYRQNPSSVTSYQK